MNLRQASALLLCAAATVLAQACVEYYPSSAFTPQPQSPPNPPPYVEGPGVPPAPPPPPPAPAPDDALVAPIALYPDPLIALILTASTVPNDVVAASSYMVQYGDPTQVDNQPWDPSVRALAHYPAVVTWMAQNISWTEVLGSAFLSSPSDVMDAVQRLRSRALASGALVSTAQQQVYSEGGQIEIYPAQADSVYIPAYDDSVVYAEGAPYGYGGSFINFGDACPAGPWLSFYFDWGHHRVWAGDKNVWHEHNGWRPPHTGGDTPPPGAHAWRPRGDRQGNFQPTDSAHGPSVVHPRPMPGAPVATPDRFKNPTVQVSQAPEPPAHPAQPKNVAPTSAPVRPNGVGPTYGPGGPRQPVANQIRSLPPPPSAPRMSAPAPSRGGEPSEYHSSSAHPSAPAAAPATAPAPAPNSNNQQPQK